MCHHRESARHEYRRDRQLLPCESGRHHVSWELRRDGWDNASHYSLSAAALSREHGFEPVTVPAGIFPSALKQVTSTSVNGTDSLTPETVTVTGTDTIWLVPGIGTVKEVTVINSNPSVTTENDLRGHIVDGTGHGLGVPVTIASGTAIWSSGSVTAETQAGGALVSTAGQVLNPVPAGTPVFASPIAGGRVLTATLGRAGAGLLAWLALRFSAPTATHASSFGAMGTYP